MDKTNNLIIIGGIGEPKWQSNNKKTWSQGYRVYDSEGIATTISAMGEGIGGHSGLYIVKPK